VYGAGFLYVGKSALKKRILHDAEFAKIELNKKQLAMTNQKMAYALYATVTPDGKSDEMIV
jgi:hypothetical protein